MRNYEVYLLFKPSLTDSALDQAIKDYEALLAKFNGKIVNLEKKGKQRLAYPVKGFKDAQHVLLEVQADHTTIPAFTKQVDISDNIIRMLLAHPAPPEKQKV